MAETQLRISSNASPYETARYHLRNNPLYTDEMWFRESKSGSLNEYISALNAIDTSEQGLESFYNAYNYEYATETDKIAALYNEAFANRGNSDAVRVGVLKDANGNPVFDADGEVKTYEYTASDYDYYKSLIKENADMRYDQWLLDQARERKNSMNGFVKVLGDIASVGTSFTYGLIDQVANIGDVFGSLAVATEAAVVDDANWLDAYAASLAHDPMIDPILDGIINFESNYTHMRDVNGNYTTLGKYIGGVGNTLGMMVPSIVTSGLLNKAGVSERVINGVSSGMFYTGATSGNIAESYRQYGASIPTQQIIANAAIKSVLEYGVERMLGSMMGGTLIDDLVFGRQAGNRMFGKTFTKQGLVRIAKDALQEGTEEVLQDFSSYYVDQTMSLINRNFGKLSELSLQSIWDAFAIGAIASIAGNAKTFLRNKSNLTELGAFVRDRNGKIKTDKDGRPIIARMNRFAQAEYDITMRSFIENVSEILSDSSTDRDYALTQAYASFRMLGSIYTEIGHDRFEDAIKVLDEIQKQPKYEDGYYKKQAMTMLQTIHDINTTISKEAVSKFKSDVSKAGISGETTVVEEENKNDVDDEKSDFYDKFKKFSPVTEAIVFAERGTDVVVVEDTVIVPEKMPVIEAVKRVTEKKLIDRIVNGKYDVDVIKILRAQYEGLRGKFDWTDEHIVAALLFEEDHAFLDFCIFNADADMFKFYSSLESLEGYIVSDEERNDPVYKLAWESFIKAYHKALVDYCKSTPEADYRRIDFTEEEIKEIEVAHELLIGYVARQRPLNEDELKVVDDILTALHVSDEVKATIIPNLTEAFAGKRVDALNRINLISENRFDGLYDGKTYLPNTSVSNRAFNSYLKSNGLTLGTLFDESNLSPSDVLVMKETSMNIRGFRKYQFTEYTNGNYNLDIVGDNKCVVTASPKLWTALTGGQDAVEHQDRYMDLIDASRIKAEREGRRKRYILSNSRGTLSSLLSDTVDPSSASYLSVNDLIYNPDLLRSEVLDFVDEKYKDAPNHIASAINAYFASNNISCELVITRRGDYKIADLSNYMDDIVDNDHFIKIISENLPTIDSDRPYEELVRFKQDAKSQFEVPINILLNDDKVDYGNLKVRFTSTPPKIRFARGAYSFNDNIINIYVSTELIRELQLNPLGGLLRAAEISAIRCTLAHELTHYYQSRYYLGDGMGSLFYDGKIRDESVKEFVIDVLSKMYPTKNAKKMIETESSEKITELLNAVENYIYANTFGEMMANGLANEITYAPFITYRQGSMITIITPWGKTYNIDYKIIADSAIEKDAFTMETYDASPRFETNYDSSYDVRIENSNTSEILSDENLRDPSLQESRPLTKDSIKRNILKVDGDKIYFKLPKTDERVTVAPDADPVPEMGEGVYMLNKKKHRGFFYYTGMVQDSKQGRIDTRRYYYYRESDGRQYLAEGGGSLYNLLRKNAGNRADKRIVEFVNKLDELASRDVNLVPREFVSALENGIFNLHNLMNWFGNADVISDEMFELINEVFFKNEVVDNFKTLSAIELQFITDYMSFRFYNIHWNTLIKIIPELKEYSKEDFLSMKVSSFNKFHRKMMDKYPEANDFFKVRLKKDAEIQTDLNTRTPKQYARELIMSLYDGRIDSVAKIAKSIRLSIQHSGGESQDGINKTNIMDDSNRGYSGNSTVDQFDEGDRYTVMASVLIKLAEALKSGDTDLMTELNLATWIQTNVQLIKQAMLYSQADLEETLRENPDVVDDFYKIANILSGNKKTVEPDVETRTPRQIVQNFKSKFNRLKSKIGVIGTEAFLNKTTIVDGREIKHRDYFMVNENGNLVINPRLYKEFTTRKGLEVEANKYLDEEVLKSIENDITAIAVTVREAYDVIVKRESELAKTKRKAEKLEEALKRSREQTAKTKEKLKSEKAKKRPVVTDSTDSSGGKYKFDLDLKVPPIIEKLHETMYTKHRKTTVQFVSDDTDNHVQLKLSEFYEQNAETLESMTQSDVDEIVYYYTHGGMFNQTDRTRIAFVSFLLRGKDGNRYPLTQEQEEALRTSLRDVISQTGRDMKQWSLVLKGWKLEESRLQYYASINDIKFRDDDIKAFADALEGNDIQKLVELKSRLYRNAVTDYRQRSELGKLLPDIEKLIELIEAGDKIADVNIKMNEIIDRISGKAAGSGEVVTLVDSAEFAKIVEDYTQRLLKLKSENDDETFKVEVFKLKTIFTPGKKADIWTKLLQFERTAMLSGPGTWVRNKTSNWSLRGFNILSDKVGEIAGKILIEKIIKKGQDQRKEIVRESRVYSTTTKWKETEQHKWVEEYLTKKYKSDDGKEEASLLDLVSSNLSKYDPRQTENKSDNWVDVITEMVTNGIRQEIFYTTIGESDFKSKSELINKTVNKLNDANTFFSEFVMKAMSDSDAVKATAIQYITQRLINEGYVMYAFKGEKPEKGVPLAPKFLLSKKKVVDPDTGKIVEEVVPHIDNEVVRIIAEAYTLAARDYMHRGNFFHELEKSMEKRLPRPAFFMYKQVLPFAAASWNWFMEGVNFTPLGLANAIKDFVKLESYVEKINTKYARGESNIKGGQAVQDLYRRLGKGIIGTIGFGVGMFLAGFGWLDIDDEDDKLKIVICDKIKVDFSDIFGSQGILIGAVMVSTLRREGVNLGKVAVATLDQMFLDSTFTDLYDAFRYTNSFGEYLTTIPTNMLSMFTPNILKTLASVISPFKVNYTSTGWKYLQRWAASSIPGAALLMPKYIDPYTGEIRYRYNDSWIKSASVTAINKLSSVDIAIYPYSDAEREALSLGLRKSPLTGRYTIDGEKVNLTSKEQQKANVLYGTLNRKELDLLFSGEKTYRVMDEDGDYVELRYDKMNDAQKKAAINGTMSANSDLVKIYVMTELRGYKYYASEEQYKKLKKLGYKNVYKNVKKNRKSGYYKK